jgi:hypothetical protein
VGTPNFRAKRRASADRQLVAHQNFLRALRFPLAQNRFVRIAAQEIHIARDGRYEHRSATNHNLLMIEDLPKSFSASVFISDGE